MPEAFQAKPDGEEEEDEEDDEDEDEEEAPQPEPPPPAMRMRLRSKQSGNFAVGEEEFRIRFLGPLRTWLAARRSATSANVMRRLREMPGFPAFARRFPFYAKADNIASRFAQMFVTVPGGTTRNPRIAAKELPAPMAEFGPVREPGTAPKGPPRRAAEPVGLAAAFRRDARRVEALFE